MPTCGLGVASRFAAASANRRMLGSVWALHIAVLSVLLAAFGLSGVHQKYDVAVAVESGFDLPASQSPGFPAALQSKWGSEQFGNGRDRKVEAFQ